MLQRIKIIIMPPLHEEIRQSTFRNERHKAVINVVYTGNWLTTEHTKFLKDFDLSEQQFNILRILRGQGQKPASITLLKERMLDKMSDVSRLVERLRSIGLVERSVCPHDRRAVEVVITLRGLALLTTIDEHIETVDAFASQLTDEELRFLNYLLDKLRTPQEIKSQEMPQCPAIQKSSVKKVRQKK
jgi:MarR family transcriptional regulator, multiple gene regulator MgrA